MHTVLKLYKNKWITCLVKWLIEFEIQYVGFNQALLHDGKCRYICCAFCVKLVKSGNYSLLPQAHL